MYKQKTRPRTNMLPDGSIDLCLVGLLTFELSVVSEQPFLSSLACKNSPFGPSDPLRGRSLGDKSELIHEQPWSKYLPHDKPVN